MAGLIFIISGPAGSGKGTVVSKLRCMPGVGLSVSATTRSPRPGEIDGESYHFMTRRDFEEKLSHGDILEHTEYCGNYYGTLRSECDRITGSGLDLILEIEVDGALQVKRLMPDRTVTVMLVAPDPAELERRLRGRGTESDKVVRQRLNRAVEEIALSAEYDYMVVNETGKINRCAADIRSIIRAEHLKRCRMGETADKYSASVQ